MRSNAIETNAATSAPANSRGKHWHRARIFASTTLGSTGTMCGGAIRGFDWLALPLLPAIGLCGVGYGLFTAATRKPITTKEQQQLRDIFDTTLPEHVKNAVIDLIVSQPGSGYYSDASAKLAENLKDSNSNPEQKWNLLRDYMLTESRSGYLENNGKKMFRIAFDALKNEATANSENTSLLSPTAY